MRAMLFLFFSLMIFSCQENISMDNIVSVSTSDINVIKDADTNAIIKSIQADYGHINEAVLSKKTLHWATPDSCQPPYMEGDVTFFMKTGKLVKIYSEGAGEHSEWKEEFYFRDDKLFFIYQNNAYGGAANPTFFKYQNRYYIDNDAVIKKIESPQDAMPADDDVQRLIRLAYRLQGVTDSRSLAQVMACDSE